jgi:hypothetical protein
MQLPPSTRQDVADKRCRVASVDVNRRERADWLRLVEEVVAGVASFIEGDNHRSLRRIH